MTIWSGLEFDRHNPLPSFNNTRIVHRTKCKTRPLNPHLKSQAIAAKTHKFSNPAHPILTQFPPLAPPSKCLLHRALIVNKKKLQPLYGTI